MRLLSAKWSMSKSNCYLSAGSQVAATLQHTYVHLIHCWLHVESGLAKGRQQHVFGHTLPEGTSRQLRNRLVFPDLGSLLQEPSSRRQNTDPVNQRMVWAGRNLEGHIPLPWEGTLQQDQAAQSPSSLTLRVSRDGASTTSLSNLCQCFITLTVKMSPLYPI